MSYLGVFEALRARLEGAAPSFVPKLPDALASRDMRANVAAENATRNTARVGKVRVPVIRRDKGAQEFTEIYPSLTYAVIDFRPNFGMTVWDTGAYGGDHAWEPLEGSEAEVFDGSVSLGVAARTARTRPVEHPFDVQVEVRAYAKDEAELSRLVEYVWRVLPPRHFLRIPRKDGTFRSCDLIWQEFDGIDPSRAVSGGNAGATREYAAVWTYTVQSFLDTTDQAKLLELVRSVSVETTTK